MGNFGSISPPLPQESQPPFEEIFVRKQILHFFFAPPGDEHQGPEGAATDGPRVLQGHGGGTHPPRLP